jgi:hypothetical protein
VRIDRVTLEEAVYRASRLPSATPVVHESPQDA